MRVRKPWMRKTFVKLKKNAAAAAFEELLEVSMQHVVGTLTQRAYNRSDWLEKRRPIMEAISDWLLG